MMTRTPTNWRVLVASDTLRRFHHYSQWEEVANGMWRKVNAAERIELLEKARVFTGDASLYGSWMMRVVVDWPISCEQNLGFTGQNRQAWVGHAACCHAINCPEDVTRAAWWLLTQSQRDAANDAADLAIAAWEKAQRTLGQLSLFEVTRAEA